MPYTKGKLGTEGRYDMSFFIEEYLRRGYQDIVVLASDVGVRARWYSRHLDNPKQRYPRKPTPVSRRGNGP